jgi:hypothetical protein
MFTVVGTRIRLISGSGNAPTWCRLGIVRARACFIGKGSPQEELSAGAAFRQIVKRLAKLGFVVPPDVERLF